MDKPPTVVWFYGLAGAGKSTAASIASEYFGGPVIDGEAVRRIFCPELGYSAVDRLEVSKNIARSLATMLNAKLYPDGTRVIWVSSMAAHEEQRLAVERMLYGREILWVLIDTQLPICEDRRKSGLAYSSDSAVRVVDSRPSPHLVLRGDHESLGEMINDWLPALQELLQHPHTSSGNLAQKGPSSFG